ncbi:hypothetical protein [Serratia marcescens]|uniref:hypothetical protein n=1 Tax=Serratia marcescens TaxID=615 RepID=UPI0006ED15E9|nr:hypothetical protein [Serratia marcescens]ALL39039.1 hypothetical protein AR325_19430 [Serratia marcescens]UJA52763.1 hypothetical protein L1F17_17430 [Serratia marcescens]UJA52819.1 hypothetical protein L1F17_17740 [Serratia marcescens]
MNIFIGVIRTLIFVASVLLVSTMKVTVSGPFGYFIAGVLLSLYCWIILKALDYMKDYRHGQ